MKFGVCLPCLGTVEAFTQEVRAAEAGGFEYLWLSDMGLQAFDVFAYLAIAALETERVRLGACVHHPHVRHLAVTLNAMATIDHISGGRGAFGIGVGSPPVIGVMGYRPAKVATMRELLIASRKLMSGETVSSDTAPFVMREARLEHAPEEPLPTYLAATGPKMLALSAELAEGCFAHVGCSAETVEFALGAYRGGLADRSRTLGPPDFTPFLHSALDADRSAAFARCREGAKKVVTRVPGYAEMVGVSRDGAAALRDRPEEATSVLSDELVDRLTLSGNVDDFARKVDLMRGCGIEHITIYPNAPDRLAMLRTIAAEVIPAFRS